MPLLLASPAIPAGGEIPVQYTCDGARYLAAANGSAPDVLRRRNPMLSSALNWLARINVE